MKKSTVWVPGEGIKDKRTLLHIWALIASLFLFVMGSFLFDALMEPSDEEPAYIQGTEDNVQRFPSRQFVHSTIHGVATLVYMAIFITWLMWIIIRFNRLYQKEKQERDDSSPEGQDQQRPTTGISERDYCPSTESKVDLHNMSAVQAVRSWRTRLKELLRLATPFSCKGEVWLKPKVEFERFRELFLKNMAIALQAERAKKLVIEENQILFKGIISWSAASPSVLSYVGRGEIKILTEQQGVKIAFHLLMTKLLLVMLPMLAFIFLIPLVFPFPKTSWVVGVCFCIMFQYAVSFFARGRFRRFIGDVLMQIENRES